MMIRILIGSASLYGLYLLVHNVFSPAGFDMTEVLTERSSHSSIEALQKSIATGEDPSRVLPATAVGSNPLNKGMYLGCSLGFIESDNDAAFNGRSAMLLKYQYQDHLYVFQGEKIAHLARSAKDCFTPEGKVDEAFHNAMSDLTQCTNADITVSCFAPSL